MPRVIAHRGASKAKPENTIDAFTTAAAMGADWVELDVRVAACGTVVVHHDHDFADGRILMQTDYADMPEGVPTLDDAITACGTMGVNVEIKNEIDEPEYEEEPERVMVPAVLEVVRRRLAPDKRLITSFDMAVINAVHDATDRVATGFLTMDRAGADVAVGRAAAHGHKAVNPWDDIVTQRWVAVAHERELEVNVWTVDDPDRIAQLADWGVDGIITNVPDVAIETLNN